MRKLFIVLAIPVCFGLVACAAQPNYTTMAKTPIVKSDVAPQPVVRSGEHVVQQGETLYSVSRLYGVPLRDLIAWNNLSRPEQLEAGQTLHVTSPPNFSPAVDSEKQVLAEQCKAYIGTIVVPQSFDTAIKSLPVVAPKGEFETAVEYNARRSAASDNVPGILIIGKEPNREYLKYDADNQQLNVQRGAFFTDSAYYSSSVHTSVIVIASAYKPGGTYEASNAFGKKATIQIVQVTTKLIASTKPSISLFDQTNAKHTLALDSAVLGTLPLNPTETKQLRPKMHVAFVISPKEPFLDKYGGDFPLRQPTFQNPSDVRESVSRLSADIRCGLLLDGSNKVLASYPAY